MERNNRAENVQKLVDALHGNLDLCIDKQIQKCESPIEELFCLGLLSEMGLLNASKGMQEMDLDLYFDVQHTIEVDDEKKYRVDFILSMYDVIFADENTPFTDWETQLIVECDGWDFHSTKEQVSDDNNRDAEILAAYGIPTIRFLGKEINANPFACAKKALDTIKGMHALEKRQYQQLVKWTRELALQKRMARLREQTGGEQK